MTQELNCGTSEMSSPAMIKKIDNNFDIVKNGRNLDFMTILRQKKTGKTGFFCIAYSGLSINSM